MRILGVGLSKTGTTSLHRALHTLGYRSLHYDDRRLNDIVHGRADHPSFRRYDDVDAVLDIPAAVFFEELMEAYPDCRCILTVRDDDEWWESIRFHFNEKSRVSSPQDDAFKWALRNFVFGSATASEFLFRKRYREHNERVVARIPAQQLLVLRITEGDGWEKLCPFLGDPVPDCAFPRENRRADLESERRTMELLIDLVPAGATFILVDDAAYHRDPVAGRRALPFLERDGEHWGLPEDDATAIAELERMRRAGATLVAFAKPALWWLDHYRELGSHLERRYRCVWRGVELVAFDLSSESSTVPRG